MCSDAQTPCLFSNLESELSWPSYKWAPVKHYFQPCLSIVSTVCLNDSAASLNGIPTMSWEALYVLRSWNTDYLTQCNRQSSSRWSGCLDVLREQSHWMWFWRQWQHTQCKDNKQIELCLKSFDLPNQEDTHSYSSKAASQGLQHCYFCACTICCWVIW